MSTTFVWDKKVVNWGEVASLPLLATCLQLGVEGVAEARHF